MNNENLQEAIGKYIESKELVLMAYPPEYIEDVKKDMEFAFRAGAKWMAEQGFNTTATIISGDEGTLRIYDLDRKKLKQEFSCGDKVILQIRKKEE